MATSSIFQDIRIKEKKDVIRFAEALEASKRDSKPIEDTDSRDLTDKSELKNFLNR